jgi:Subtilase family/Immunoglobulin domain/Bacterial TSP3 repeat/Immunoglobulin I-set domain
LKCRPPRTPSLHRLRDAGGRAGFLNPSLLLQPMFNVLRILPWLYIGCGLIAAPAQAAPVGTDAEFIIKWRPRTEAGLARPPSGERTFTVQRHFERIGWQEIRTRGGQTLEALRHDPDVLAVETNFLATAIPNLPQTVLASAATAENAKDPKAEMDDPLRAGQWALAKVHAPEAWRITNGSAEVVVVVIDTGINYRHEDLAANLWHNPGEIPDNGIDDDGNGWVDDVHGIDVANDAHGNDCDPMDQGVNRHFHGTMVAGIIGATGRNGRGITGLNQTVRLMAVRAIRTSNQLSLADELEALEYVLLMKQRGVNIRAVNMSYGGLPKSAAEHDAIAALLDAGIVVCAAAGNSGRNNDLLPSYPASHPLPGLIAVAATDETDRLAKFPPHGGSHFGRISVDLAAPGLEIFSTSGPGTSDYEPAFFGTSAAAPHVAGAAALLAAANPRASVLQIKEALLESVDLVPALTNKLISHGRLNVARALDHPWIASGPPRILEQPVSQTTLLGTPFLLVAEVTGQKPRALQWLHDGVPILGATNVAFSPSHATMTDAGEYRLRVTNALGGVESDTTVVEIVPLEFTSPPLVRRVRAGSAVRFKAAVKGPGPFHYQWLFNGDPVPGATNASLKIPRVTLAHEGSYSVTAANAFGQATGEIVSLSVLVRSVIVVPPVSQAVVQGGSFTFSAGFTGHPEPFEVDWRRGSVVHARQTGRATESFFTLTNVQPAHAGTWRVTVQNAASPGGVRASCKLTVLPDVNGDGLPDVLNALPPPWTNTMGNAESDFDGDGLSNREEYIAGTNPTNAQSRLELLATGVTNGVTWLRFLAMSNRTYSVERALAADGPWLRLHEVLAARTNRVMSVTDSEPTPNMPASLYRVVTPRQP